MRIALLMTAALLSGCGSFVPTVDLKSLAPETIHQVRGITIYDANLLSQAQYTIIGVIEGHSCQNKIWDPPATRLGAVDQLKYHAWEAGANGLSNIQCGGREGTSTRTNCWELISCTANAIQASSS